MAIDIDSSEVVLKVNHIEEDGDQYIGIALEGDYRAEMTARSEDLAKGLFSPSRIAQDVVFSQGGNTRTVNLLLSSPTEETGDIGVMAYVGVVENLMAFSISGKDFLAAMAGKEIPVKVYYPRAEEASTDVEDAEDCERGPR